ncbi:MAG: CDP-glucose 4,6-dehydratase [Kiritimatiellae bacterium]|nr:CDP-glucose 4,6-dehydratase [Kiritimatiellia bacterium]
MDLSSYRGKRAFITGHTGFKGSWLALWLHHLGADVYGYSLPPPTTPSNYILSDVHELMSGETIADIRDYKSLRQALQAADPDVVFHLAAQPLVRRSYEIPCETFEVNVLGTSSLLDAVRIRDKPCAVVCVTSDKCYENREQVWGYRENDPMGGNDPYSASKGACELLIASYRHSFFNPATLASHGIQIASARAGNVIGGGDWGSDRILPDIMRSVQTNSTIQIRNPDAVRPWQHVLEPLSGYLSLAGAMMKNPCSKWCKGWNFGPLSGSEATVAQLVGHFIEHWGSGSWQDCFNRGQPHEAKSLRLCIDQALSDLEWHPRWQWQTAVAKTASWHKRVLSGKTRARHVCETDIEEYEQLSDTFAVPSLATNRNTE